METRARQKTGGSALPAAAWRRAALVLALSVSLVSPASAFELFGWKWPGSARETEDPVEDPRSYSVEISVADPGDGAADALRIKLEAASELVESRDKPAAGSLGIITRANADYDRLVGALYEDARYGAAMTVRLNGLDLATLPPDHEFPAGKPVDIRIAVEPGRQFTFGRIRIDGAAPGDAGPELAQGAVAGSGIVIAAEEKLVAALKDEGHPFAKVASRDIVADHDTNTLDVAITLSDGPLARFGETRVEGASEVDAGYIARMADLPAGEVYTPEELKKAAKRLNELGVFESVTVSEDENLAADGTLPVVIRVSERKMRYYGGGATISNTEGAGLEAYWGHRNLFGRAEKLRISGSVGRLGAAKRFADLDWKTTMLFEKPGAFGPATSFIANLDVTAEHPDAYRRFSISGAAGVRRLIGEQQTISAALKLDYSDARDVFGRQKTLTVSLPIEYVIDSRDNRLDPATGYRLLAYAEPTWETLDSAYFVKLRGEVSAYKAFGQDNKVVLAGRLAGGSILGAGLSGVPADRRFYAGGGGSVRGYAYQGIGPHVAGKPTGGLSYAEGSLELRTRITETFGMVAFLDGGAVSTSRLPGSGVMRFGAGAGIRYMTPLGPLRVDVGIPLQRRAGDPAFGIYAGVGQAF